MIKYVNGKDTDIWLPKYWRKSTFPLLEEESRDLSKIIGSSFLIWKSKRVYAVTAAHVLRDTSPTLVLATQKREFMYIDPKTFDDLGLRWIEHPAGLDLAAVPFPSEMLEGLDVHIIEENVWTPAPRMRARDGTPLVDPL